MNIKTLDLEIYSVLKKIRLSKSLSQEQLAHISDKDRTYISSIERGERNISLKTLIDILVAMEVDFDMFIKELRNNQL